MREHHSDNQNTPLRHRAPPTLSQTSHGTETEVTETSSNTSALFGNATLSSSMGTEGALSLPLQLHTALHESGFPDDGLLFGGSNELMNRVLGATSMAQQAAAALAPGGGVEDAAAAGALFLLRHATGGAVPDVVASRIERALTGGRPLPDATRVRMESAFHHSFDHVRIHTGGVAGEAARSISALAFTSGSDIVFSDGAFAPHTATGEALLAHELTHVVQGDEGRLPSGGAGHRVSSPTDPHEQEAEARAAEITARTAAWDRAGAWDAVASGEVSGLDALVQSLDAILDVGPGAAATAGASVGVAPAASTAGMLSRRPDSPPETTDDTDTASLYVKYWREGKIDGETVTVNGKTASVKAARTYNANAHTVTFINKLRAELVAALQAGLGQDAADTQAGETQTRLPDASGTDNVSPTDDPKSAFMGLIDGELVRMIVAWKVANGSSADGSISSDTYSALVKAFPALAYETPTLKSSGGKGDFKPDKDHKDQDVMSGTSESERYDIFAKVIAGQSGVFFKEPFYVNALGLRGVKAVYQRDDKGQTDYNSTSKLTLIENTVGSWDDCIVAVWVDAEGSKHCKIFGGTVDSSSLPGKTEGNLMAAGQHLYREDTHQGSRATPYTALGAANEALNGQSQMPGYRMNDKSDGLRLRLGEGTAAPTYDNIHTTHQAGNHTHKAAFTQAFRRGSVTLQAHIQGQSPAAGTTTTVLFAALAPFWSTMQAARSSGEVLEVVTQAGGKDTEGVTLPDKTTYKSIKLTYKIGKNKHFADILQPPGASYSALVKQPKKVTAVETTEQLVSRDGSQSVSRPDAAKNSVDDPGKYSLGCQVIKSQDHFDQFLDLVHQGKKNGQQVFPYTLVSGDTLKGVLDQIAAADTVTTDDTGGGQAAAE